MPPFPPILVDKHGKFYGYFTANKYASKRTNNEIADIACKNYEPIRDNVGEWFDRMIR